MTHTPDMDSEAREPALATGPGRAGSPQHENGTGAPEDAAAFPVDLSPGALRRHFSAAFEPRPALYWTDLLCSATLGWGCFVLSSIQPAWSAAGMVLLLAATLALYRAVLFIHELTHLRRGSVRGFETVWNLLVGLPLMVPSLMYVGSHNEHHKRAIYGTDADPEYEALAFWSPLRIVASTATMFVIPAALVLRWGLFGPLSWLVPPARPFVVGRLSTLAINPRYVRPMPQGKNALRWRLQETGGAVLVWTVVAACALGWLGWEVLARWYVVGCGILTLNHLRTLAAHRYDRTGDVLTEGEQLLDSVNLVGPAWITALGAPVGLRYHALHHMLPALPYHSLGAVHRTLMREVPADSPYLQVSSQGIVKTVRTLLRRADGYRRSGGTRPGGRSGGSIGSQRPRGQSLGVGHPGTGTPSTSMARRGLVG